MTARELVGVRIREARERLNMTQEELGRALVPYLGKAWPRQAVFVAERGRRAFTVEELLSLAAALGTSVTFLLSPPDVGKPVRFPSGHEVSGEDLLSLLFYGPGLREPFSPIARGPLAAPLNDVLSRLDKRLEEARSEMDLWRSLIKWSAEQEEKERGENDG
jgi:transcriptional regulator with XRE-family HTH domain